VVRWHAWYEATRDRVDVLLARAGRRPVTDEENRRVVLPTLAAVVEDLEGWFMHRGESVPPEPSWRLIAELLDAAVVYE
jgi:hypothetical protein